MDRQILYPSQVLLDSDLLSMQKNSLVGLGYALADILGITTCVAGLPCTQTLVASLAVLVGPGRIYSFQNIDGTAYGSLPSDTANQIGKQGILQGNTTLATPAPVTAGQSINYLVEASYQDSDTTPVVSPFYNPTNPIVPFSGIGGLGAPTNTQRKGTLVLQIKAGTPATTGSQTTPAPDAGFVGLYAVTVANGQATVTSTNIAPIAGAPFLPANLGSPLISCQQTALLLTTTTLVNTGLSLPVAAGRYALDMLFVFNGVTTGTQGIQFGFAGITGSSTIGAYSGRVNSAGVTGLWNGIPNFATIGLSTNLDSLMIRASLNVTLAGTLTIQAALNSASANGVQFGAASYMQATKIA